jgi:hypothetical protein
MIWPFDQARIGRLKSLTDTTPVVDPKPCPRISICSLSGSGPIEVMIGRRGSEA